MRVPDSLYTDGILSNSGGAFGLCRSRFSPPHISSFRNARATGANPAILDLDEGTRIWILDAGDDRGMLSDPTVFALSDVAAARRIRPFFERRRWLASRALLRRALSAHAGGAVPPAQWRFVRNRYGKPAIADGLPDIRFSLSHIRSGTLLAISRDRTPGIDVEECDQEIGESTFDTVLSPAERRRLAGLAGTARRHALIELWTLKEAYAKLLGVGHSADFSAFEFSLRPLRLESASPHAPVALRSWQADLDGRRCQIALATRPGPDGPAARAVRTQPDCAAR